MATTYGFEVLDATRDYHNNQLNIQYEGDMSPFGLFLYVSLNYPEFARGEILEHTPESEFRGMQNPGTVTIGFL